MLALRPLAVKILFEEFVAFKLPVLRARNDLAPNELYETEERTEFIVLELLLDLYPRVFVVFIGYLIAPLLVFYLLIVCNVLIASP